MTNRNPFTIRNIMFKSDTLISSFDDYMASKVGVTDFINYETTQGRITYYADKDHSFDGMNILIYYINVKEKLRHTGIFKTLINYISDNSKIKSITIMAIGNYYLDSYLNKVITKGHPWKVNGADRKWKNL